MQKRDFYVGCFYFCHFCYQKNNTIALISCKQLETAEFRVNTTLFIAAGTTERFTDHFSNPGRAFGVVWCQEITFKQNDL